MFSPNLKPAREAAVKHLDQLLKAARSNPNPKEGQSIRMTCTRAILALMIAKSPEQVEAIYQKALNDLPEQHQEAA